MLGSFASRTDVKNEWGSTSTHHIRLHGVDMMTLLGFLPFCAGDSLVENVIDVL
jgi:hypothetical protein